MRTYDFSTVSQFSENQDADLVPSDREAAAALFENLSFDATVWGLTAALQYAQLSDFVWGRANGTAHRLNSFNHRGDVAGPDYQEFRVPNVDTLYSNGWLSLEKGPIELDVPDVGGRYYTVNLLDAHGNASNVSNRTHGSGPLTVVICTAEQAESGDLGDRDVVIVSTPVIWALLRVQGTGEGGWSAAHTLRQRFDLRELGEPADSDRIEKVDSGQVETSWFEFARALNAMIEMTGVPADEVALYRRYRVIGLGAQSDLVEVSGDREIVAALQRGFDQAMTVLRRSRAQLGVKLASGWTRVSNKGRHGSNFIARAVMNNVGLGANVVEENTSFNTYVSSLGEPLDGRKGKFELVLESTAPVSYFWSVTLYVADTGRVYDNAWGKYSVGREAHSDDGDPGPVRILIDPDAFSGEPSGTDDVLPAPLSEFFLVLRAYGPRHALLNGEWVPDPVRPLSRVGIEGVDYRGR